MSAHPRSVPEIVENYQNRKEGLRKALTDGAASRLEFWALLRAHPVRCARRVPDRRAAADVDSFFQKCHPDKDNMCLYGAELQNWPHGAPLLRFARGASGAFVAAIVRLMTLRRCAGEANGTWAVDLPAEEVPAELPEPCLGINFARDGMAKKDWLALVAVHSDAWLLAVAFYYGAKLSGPERCDSLSRTKAPVRASPRAPLLTPRAAHAGRSCSSS